MAGGGLFWWPFLSEILCWEGAPHTHMLMVLCVGGFWEYVVHVVLEQELC